MFESIFDFPLLNNFVLMFSDEFVLSVHDSSDYTVFILKRMMGLKMHVLVGMLLLLLFLCVDVCGGVWVCVLYTRSLIMPSFFLVMSVSRKGIYPSVANS